MKKTHARKMIGIFEANTPSTAQPNRCTTVEEARRLAGSGEATFINHGTAIRLIGQPIDPPANWESIPAKGLPRPVALGGGTRQHGDGGDAHALAGSHFSEARLTRTQRERFVGWKITPHTAGNGKA
jgi:hypothetical protein